MSGTHIPHSDANIKSVGFIYSEKMAYVVDHIRQIATFKMNTVLGSLWLIYQMSDMDGAACALTAELWFSAESYAVAAKI